ncbi:MAG: ACT domain-containing protein [Planctomycetia bacterium]|nr:ACT domain-containing protein [Planctomycetia bacterium]
MALTITKVDTWVGEVADRPGAAAEALEGLAKAGVNLEFLLGRRKPDQPGRGVIFVTGIKGAKGTKAAAAAGFEKSSAIGTLRVVGADKAGAVHKLVRAVGDAGLSLRGVAAQAVGTKFAATLAFDSQADAAKAASALKKMK